MRSQSITGRGKIRWILGYREVVGSLVAVLGVFMLSCGTVEVPPSNNTPTGPQLLATIDGRQVHQSDFAAFIRLNEGSEDAESESLFPDFITEILLETRAEAAGIALSDEEASSIFGEWIHPEQNLGPDEARALRRFLKIQRWFQRELHPRIEVGWEEVLEYYSRNVESFVAEDRVRVLEILVSDRTLLEEIRMRVEPGDVLAFQEEARRHSKGSSAQKGGDQGTFIQGQLPSEFDRVIFKLKAGEVSEILQSRLGYHLFMVSERVPRHHQKFFEVQRDIYERLLAEKERRAIDEMLKQILQDASIEIHDETLRSQWRKRHGAIQG